MKSLPRVRGNRAHHTIGGSEQLCFGELCFEVREGSFSQYDICLGDFAFLLRRTHLILAVYRAEAGEIGFGIPECSGTLVKQLF